MLSQRRLEPEIMDDPALDAGRHRRALRGLERINRWSASVGSIWGRIRRLAADGRPSGLRILDVATGAGDVPIGLWRRACRAGLDVALDGCDVSPQALEYARRRARQRRADVRFFRLDALTEPLPPGYDVITASLFLHHLPDEHAAGLLGRMARAAGALVIVSDLERSLPGLCLAYAGTRLLSRSDVVHTDGPRSVRAAYTVDEVSALAQRAGLPGAVVARRWPCRWFLTWARP